MPGCFSVNSRSLLPRLAGCLLAASLLTWNVSLVDAQVGVGSNAAPKSYAFLVACSDYDKRELNKLEYTVEDVNELYRVLIASGFSKDNIVLMHDQQPRHLLPEGRKIREQLDLLLARIDHNATLVVALSGHGVQFEGRKGNYFCPLDARLQEVETLLSLEELYRQLEACPAQRKLLFVDACRNNPQSTLARSRATVTFETARLQEDNLPQGIVALFSCSSGQQSFEHPDLKHGVFFHHLLQAWKGAADQNRDRQLTLDELLNYTKEKTEIFAHLELKAKQIPHFRGDFTGTWVLRELPLPPAGPEGLWRIASATGFQGEPYGGKVQIEPGKEGLYHLTWTNGAGEPVQQGLGFFENGHLYAAWGVEHFGINFYKIRPDGSLLGRWTHFENSTIGMELASGGTPGKLEGQYSVRGTSIGEGGGEYTGNLRIARYGDTYYLGWRAAPNNDYYGIGIRNGDLLVVGWSMERDKQFGVVDYTLEADRARGRWTMIDQTSIAREDLQRIAP